MLKNSLRVQILLHFFRNIQNAQFGPEITDTHSITYVAAQCLDNTFKFNIGSAIETAGCVFPTFFAIASFSHFDPVSS